MSDEHDAVITWERTSLRSAMLGEKVRVKLLLDTDLVKDTVVLRMHPHDRVGQLLELVQSRYDDWHAFPVYGFQVLNPDFPREDEKAVFASDLKILDLPKGIPLVAVESESSKLRRSEEVRKAQEEKQRREEEVRRKEEERRRIIQELAEKGDCWTLENNVQSLDIPIEEQGLIVRNRGSLEQWCPIHRIRPIPAKGKSWFSIKILKDPPTTNTWRFSIGVVPLSFKVNAERRWVGSQKSWAYVGGNGGKCHNSGKIETYGLSYGAGDVIGVLLDFDASTIEFFHNGISQGIAFRNLVGPVYPAVSMTAKDAEVLLCNEYPAHLAPVIEESMLLEKMRLDSWSKISSEDFYLQQLSEFKETGLNSWDVRFSLVKDRSLFFPDEKACVVLNEGSGDKWRTARSVGTYSSGKSFFEIVLDNDPPTVNTWRLCIGVIPADFQNDKSRIWVGAQNSWAYIAGTGGKSFNSGQSVAYGEPYEQGDVIGVLMNFDDGTLEFFRNGISQGIAFSNLVGPVHAAVSMTGTDAKLTFRSAGVSEIHKYRDQAVEKASKLSAILKTCGNIWDHRRASKDLEIAEDHITVSNLGSGNKWRAVASLLPYSSGRRYFEVVITECPYTTNSWKICVGVVPRSFNFSHAKLWVGAQKSWGYIAGTGGKCYDSGKSVAYGSKFAQDDRIGVLMDFDNRTIEFFKNGVSQGLAFQDLSAPVFAAVSLAGTGAKVVLDAAAEARQDLIDSLFLYK
jgi:hypothetical protein